jgi:hypothetical protein
VIRQLYHIGFEKENSDPNFRTVRLSHALIHKYFLTNLITPSQVSVPRTAAMNEYAPKGKVKGSES